MANFKTILCVVVLLVSLVLLFDKFFTPQPIQIILQSGQEVTTSTSDYFSLTETILLVVCSFLIGTTATYLFHNSDASSRLRTSLVGPALKSDIKAEVKEAGQHYDAILPLLKDDEKKVIMALKESNGEMLQNKLVLRLNLPKVKVTRLLYSLERKNLILKQRNGLTNNIKLIILA